MGKRGEYIYPRYILPFHRFSTGAKGAVGSSSWRDSPCTKAKPFNGSIRTRGDLWMSRLIFGNRTPLTGKKTAFIGGLNSASYTEGVSKESINQQHTAGTFGRPVSSCEWIFSNVPFYFSLLPWIRLSYRELQAENEVRHYWDIWQMSLFLWTKT